MPRHAHAAAHLDVLDAQALRDGGREHARRKRAAEDRLKLLVQAADAQLLKVDGLGFEDLRGRKALLARDLDGVAARVGEDEGGGLGEVAALDVHRLAGLVDDHVVDGELVVAALQLKRGLLVGGEDLRAPPCR